MTKTTTMTTTKIDTLAMSLKVGDRFFYTGDMANGASFGTIIARNEDPRWGLSYSAEYDDERFEGDKRTTRGLAPCCFTAGPGQHFKTLLQHNTERDEARKRLEEVVKGLKG